MPPAEAIIAGLTAGVVLCGLLFVVVFRREPRKAVNIAVLTLGLSLLTYGHLHWMARRESPEGKQAMFIRHVVAGWALVAMGFVGLQLGSGSGPTKGDEP